jgi:ATP-dependent Clp protease ATP-binding subunit ClpA
MPVSLTKDLEATFGAAYEEARKRHHEFLTLEHVLYAMTKDRHASRILTACGGDVAALRREIDQVFEETMEALPEGARRDPEQTDSFRRVLQRAAWHVQSSGRQTIEAGDILIALYREPSSQAAYLLEQNGVTRLDLMRYLSHGLGKGQEPRAQLPGRAGRDGRDGSDGASDGAGGPGSGGDPGEEDEEGGQPAADPLKAYTVNLVEKAAQGQIDPLIGREPELQRTIQVLCRRRRNNPIYVGEPGVGKTAIAEGLALAIHEGKVPDLLKDAVVYSLDMGALLAGTRFRGQFEERLKGVVDALKQKPKSILFIDEIHTVVGAGATMGGSMDASNLLKPALSSGEIRCIGSTTYKEYKASFERDRALERRFQRIEVGEPSVDETIKILGGLRPHYEKHHGVKYLDEALKAAAELSHKYINDRHLPDKAIDVIDEAGAADRLLGDHRKTELGPLEIEGVVATMAKVPARSVSASDEEAIAKVEPELKKVIYGQDRAIETLVTAIKLSRAGLGAADKPIGSFLFAGPTGVGKTELSKQLARVLGVEFLRFDMTEYMEKHTVSRLIGAPPGYVGFDQGGLLTDAIRKTPYAVLVLDEIEKAHPDVFNILLQVMDHATLTDNVGRKADFRHVIIVLTTNAGAREMASNAIGFGDPADGAAAGRGKQALERMFGPEFRNRLDAIVTFDQLSPEVILRVVDKQLGELRSQLEEKKVTLELTDGARKWLAEHGFDRKFGARPMARLIQNELKKPLAEALLFGKLKGQGGKAIVEVAPPAEGDKLTVRMVPAAEANN